MSAGASHFLRPLLQKDAAPSVLRDAESGRVLAADLELTLDSESRRRGLLGRDSLEEGAALIIAPCNGVHMFFMRFAIDVVFVNRQGLVLKVCQALKPWRIGICLKAFAAIEVPAGAAARAGISAGRTIEVAEK